MPNNPISIKLINQSVLSYQDTPDSISLTLKTGEKITTFPFPKAASQIAYVFPQNPSIYKSYPAAVLAYRQTSSKELLPQFSFVGVNDSDFSTQTFLISPPEGFASPTLWNNGISFAQIYKGLAFTLFDKQGVISLLPTPSTPIKTFAFQLNKNATNIQIVQYDKNTKNYIILFNTNGLYANFDSQSIVPSNQIFQNIPENIQSISSMQTLDTQNYVLATTKANDTYMLIAGSQSVFVPLNAGKIELIRSISGHTIVAFENNLYSISGTDYSFALPTDLNIQDIIYILFINNQCFLKFKNGVYEFTRTGLTFTLPADKTLSDVAKIGNGQDGKLYIFFKHKVFSC